MPHTWNNILVVTKDELVPAWYNWNTLKNTINNYSDKEYGIKRVQLGGNGRQMLISFDSLPPHIQDGIGDPRKHNHLLENYYKVDGEAVVFFKTFQFDDNSYLLTEYQEKYIVNASVLKAAIHLHTQRLSFRKALSTPSPKGTTKILACDVASFNEVLRIKHGVTHTLPPGEKAFKQCLNAFETNGYGSLISRKHKNDNSRKVFEETLSLLESMFAKDKTKPTATEVSRRYDAFINGTLEIINNNTAEVYNPADYESIGANTVKKYLTSWKSSLGTHALRSGDRQKLMGKYKPYHSLKRPEFAGSIISIDDRQPPFKAPDGKRVWFYNAFDLGSYAFTCWVHGATKDGIILDFYRQLVRNYVEWGFNLPNELEAEMSLNSSFTNTFLREGAMFQQVRIEANNARAKYIERVYGSLRYEYEKQLDGFIPRPFAKSESNQPGPAEIKVMPYSRIIEQCLQQIEDWNNRPHPVKKELTRWEYFCQNQHPNLKPTNYLAILPHMGYRTKTSCNVGIIHLDRGEFLLGDNGKVALGQKLINLMQRVEGCDISVYWLDDNKGKVFKALVFIGDQYICEAVAKPTYHRAKIEQTPECHEARAIMSAYVATIEGYGKRQRQSIEAVTLIDNKPKREKTFIMPGLKQYPYYDEKEEAESLPYVDLNKENDEYEALSEQTFFVPLKDRY